MTLRRLLPLLLAASCGLTARAAEPLRIAAASDLQAALPEVIERFHASTGIEVVPTFGASGQLAEQIKAGAPYDVFLSANLKFVKDLASAGDVRPDSVRPYARGSLVLVVNRNVNMPVDGLADLTRPEIKTLAIANPRTAPYGAAAKQALERSQLWGATAPKRVQAETVRQALQFVQTGNAEAALVGRSIADVKEVRVVEVDPKLYDAIIQGLGIVARSKRQADANAFSDYLLGKAGQAALAEFGFCRADANPASARRADPHVNSVPPGP